MSGISTHILDTAIGRPAAGVAVQLFFEGRELTVSITNEDGRIQDLLPPSIPLFVGIYKLVFAVGARWPDSFYPEVSVTFSVKDLGLHYHVPLLISPFGFTTYRGS